MTSTRGIPSRKRGRDELRAIAPAIFCFVVAACGDDAPAPAGASFEPLPIESLDSALWTGRLAADDPVVASVEGTPITLGMLRTQIQRQEDRAEPARVLERMIELELLAREAFAAGKYTKDVVGDEVKQTLARRFAEATFDEHIGKADIPPDIMKKAYDHAVSRYDHYERFLMVDVQLLCCTEMNPEACYRDELPGDVSARLLHRKSCFDALRPAASAMHAALATSTGDKARFKVAAEAVAAYSPSPDLRAQFRTQAKVHEYDFQYDVDRSYEEQYRKIRYPIFLQAVMEGVAETWIRAGRRTPVLTPVIESLYGYHIIYIYEVQPEKHWTVDHPEAQREIRDAIYDKWRTLYYQQTMDRLCKELRCEVYEERLVPLQQIE